MTELVVQTFQLFLTRDIRIDPKLCQIGSKWDKSGTLPDQISVDFDSNVSGVWVGVPVAEMILPESVLSKVISRFRFLFYLKRFLIFYYRSSLIQQYYT